MKPIRKENNVSKQVQSACIFLSDASKYSPNLTGAGGSTIAHGHATTQSTSNLKNI